MTWVFHQLENKGMHMPAFSFEKIEPPAADGPVPPAAKQQRSVFVQLLDRLVETRLKRTLDEEGSAAREQKPTE
jgi:hypothetical protein